MSNTQSSNVCKAGPYLENKKNTSQEDIDRKQQMNQLKENSEMKSIIEKTDQAMFGNEYFSPYVIPTIKHTPWKTENLPIPTTLYKQALQLIEEKDNNEVHNFTRLLRTPRWFCILTENDDTRPWHSQKTPIE